MSGPPLPPAPSAGTPLTATWGIQLLRWCRANTLLPSPGMLLSRTTNGTSYRPQPTANLGGGAAAAPPGPFDITLSANDPGDDDGCTASFYPGTGGGYAPDNVLDDLDVPSGDLSYVYLEISTSGTTPLSCIIKIDTTAPDTGLDPVKGALPQTVRVLLYLIDYTAPVAAATVGTYAPYRVAPEGNVTLGSIEAFRTSVADPDPGALPYDIWYTWTVGSDGV